MNTAIVHYYRKARQHQMDAAADDAYMLTVDQSGRTERTYGGAPYGEHAKSAYWSARRAIHFRNTLAADIAAREKRSKAAKRGWKKRKSA